MCSLVLLSARSFWKTTVKTQHLLLAEGKSWGWEQDSVTKIRIRCIRGMGRQNLFHVWISIPQKGLFSLMPQMFPYLNPTKFTAVYALEQVPKFKFFILEGQDPGERDVSLPCWTIWISMDAFRWTRHILGKQKNIHIAYYIIPLNTNPFLSEHPSSADSLDLMPGGKRPQLRFGTGLLWVLCWFLSSCPGTSGTPWIKSVYLSTPHKKPDHQSSPSCKVAYYFIVFWKHWELKSAVLTSGLFLKFCELQTVSFGSGTADWWTMITSTVHRLLSPGPPSPTSSTLGLKLPSMRCPFSHHTESDVFFR